MSIEKIYEADSNQDYATGGNGQVVSRSLFAVVERGDMPLDGGFDFGGEIVEVEPSGSQTEPTRIRIDTVPQDTIAVSPDAAAVAAGAMQRLARERGDLSFRVEYQA
jgi:hypothetical protein